MCSSKEKELIYDPDFENKYFDESRVSENPEYDLVTIYEKCIEEMTLQQSKRDQIITIFLAIFSFAVSYILFSDKLGSLLKGLVFLAIALIGIGFSLIIIRYRMYKEAYWICCQALTNLMSFKVGEIDKKTIQSIYYSCMYKKGKSFVKGKGKNRKFRRWEFFKKNIFSGETIYCLIHMFIVSVLLGLSIVLLTSNFKKIALISGIAVAVISFLLQLRMYFENLIETYGVLVDGKESSFNKAFSKAWFLHLYVDPQEREEEENTN